MDLFKSMKTRNVGPAGESVESFESMLVDANPTIILCRRCFWPVFGNLPLWNQLGFPIFDDQKFTLVGAISIYQKNPISSGRQLVREISENSPWLWAGESTDLWMQEKTPGIWWDWEKNKAIHRINFHPEDPNTYLSAKGSPWESRRPWSV